MTIRPSSSRVSVSGNQSDVLAGRSAGITGKTISDGFCSEAPAVSKGTRAISSATALEKIMNAPVNRRTLFATSIALSATGGAGAALGAEPAMSEIETLIARYSTAQEAADAAWGAVPRIEWPPVGVQIGRTFLGKDDETLEDVYQPIIAGTANTIDQHYERHMRASISIHGRTPARVAEIKRQYAELAERKKAELASQRAAVKQVEDEMGVTAAVDIAEGATAALEGLRTEIVGYQPRSLLAVARKAAWCLETLHDADMDEMRRILRSFAMDDICESRIG